MILKLEKVVVDPKIEVRKDDYDIETPYAVWVDDRIAMWLSPKEAHDLMNKLRARLG